MRKGFSCFMRGFPVGSIRCSHRILYPSRIRRADPEKILKVITIPEMKFVATHLMHGSSGRKQGYARKEIYMEISCSLKLCQELAGDDTKPSRGIHYSAPLAMDRSAKRSQP